MAALSAPPPPPPPLLFSTVNDFSSNQISDIQKPVVKDTSNVQEKAGTVPLRPAQLRNYSQKWSLAGDAGLLLYLQEFSQRMLSKTTDIEKLVDNIHNSTKGSGVRIHNTFNDFLMLSSSQFIENRVYDEETVDDKNEKELLPKKEKTREEIEAEIIPRFKEAVNYGFVVLDNSFITVEIKPVEDSDDEDNEVLPTHATDPIIEPKDVYGNRRLPHLIGTAEFLHDETLGLLELPSDDDEEGAVEGSKEHSEESSEKVSDHDSDQDSDQDSEEDSEGDQSSNDFEVENKADSQKSQGSKQELSDNQQLDDEDDLFGEKKQSVEKDGDTVVMPKSDLQSELASKLSLGRKNVVKKSSDDEWDSKSTQEANEKPAQSISSQKITENKLNQEVFSKTNSGVKNVELHKEKRSKSKNSEKISDDEDLFGPTKKDDIFGVKENEGLFTQKKGLFSGTGNNLFDEPEEDLFTETSTKQNIQPANTSQVLTETQSVVKKIPVGGVSIFGESGASLFHQKKESSSSFSAGQTPAKTPVVKGLFNNDDDDDSEAKKDTIVVQKTIPRKKTLEFFEDNDGDDLFGEKKQRSVPTTKNNIVQPKTESILGNSLQSKESQAPSSSNKKPFSLFDDENEDGDNDDIFSSLGKTQSKQASPIKLIGESANNKTILKDEKNQSLGKPASLITNDQSDDQLFNSKPLKKQTAASEATKKLTSFGSDSSDDDLFSIKPAAKTKEVKKETAQVIKDVPKTVVAPQKTVESHKSIKLFDDDTQDDLFSTDKIFDASSGQIPADSLFKDTNAAAKSTKPIGSVSLFGGINPLLDKKKLSAEPSTLHPAVIDDDDDLFSSKKNNLPISEQNSSKLANTTMIPAISKNEVIPTVSSSKSNINFDGTKSDAGKLPDATTTSNKKLTPFGSDDSDDDLFTTSKSKLPAKTINAAKVVEAEPINKKEVVKTSQTVPQKSASTSKKVFSFDSSDDDLFSTKPLAKTKETVKVETVPIIKNASNTVDAPVQKIVKVESNKSLNLFDDDTQDDLFSPKKHTTKATSILPPAASSTEDIDTAAKPKKIGVSLFDGTDSLPKEKNLKPKLSALPHDVFDDEEDLFLSNKKSIPDLKFDPSKSREKAGAVKISDSVSADNVDSLASVSNNSPLKLPLKAESGIGKLQASLNLNPANMVPGKVPNKRSSTSESVTFDEQAEVKILENKTKTRARGNVSRRPPSRKPHQTLDKTDSFNDDPTKANIAENSSRQDENFKVLNSPLFPDSVNVVSPQGQQKVSLKNNVLFEDDNSSTLSRENLIKDSIFRNTDTETEEFFKKESTDDFRHHKSKATTDSSTDFVDAPSKETPPSDSFNDLFSKNDALKKNTAKIEDIFSSESDLFNSSLISSRKINEGNEGKTADETKKDKLFSSENQTEKFVSSEKKNTPRVKKQPQVNLFGDEAGSIFDDILPSSTKKKEDKKDTWDIFGPSNDVDDIFSTPKRTTKSKKKTVKGPVKSSLNVNSASIFDDPLSGGD